MQLTIISTKLPGQTNAEFEYEFREVHAAATKDMASSLGIISRYVQGIFFHAQVPGDKSHSLPHLPLPRGSEDLQSLAQLTWPSTSVLKGALKTSGYRNSAGKHVFAKPAQLFLTEPLEPASLGAQEPNILLIMVVIPLSKERVAFRRAWDEHAAKFHGKCAHYQRNPAMSLSLSQVEEILGGSQFTPALCQLEGGYEEFGFPTLEDAQRFLGDHREDLEKSYASFCDPASYCLPSDYVVQYGESDIGVQQKLVGKIVSTILSVKATLGL